MHLPVPVFVVGHRRHGEPHHAPCEATLLDELGKQYVTTARAKGLKEGSLIRRYPVGVALNPSSAPAGALLRNCVLGRNGGGHRARPPTIGPVMYRALLAEDMYLAASCVMVMSILTVIGFLISDIILAFTDPRIRLG